MKSKLGKLRSISLSLFFDYDVALHYVFRSGYINTLIRYYILAKRIPCSDGTYSNLCHTVQFKVDQDSYY